MRLLGGEIDLSPAAKSHCMRLSDRQHYSQSLWINSTAAPHNPFAFPPDKLSHSQAVHDGKASRMFSIKSAPIRQVSEDLFCKASAA